MTSPRNPRHIWRLAFAITACATVFTIMQGLTYPLLALILNRMDVPEWLIGINAATMPIGMIVSAPLAPRLMRRFGGRNLTVVSLVTSAVCLLAIGATQDAWLWMPLRLLTGIALGCILVVNESWINQIASDNHRGRIIGFYSAVLSAGFALGPALLAIVGSRGWAPFLIGACASSFISRYFIRRSVPLIPSCIPNSSKRVDSPASYTKICFPFLCAALRKDFSMSEECTTIGAPKASPSSLFFSTSSVHRTWG